MLYVCMFKRMFCEFTTELNILSKFVLYDEFLVPSEFKNGMFKMYDDIFRENKTNYIDLILLYFIPQHTF